MWKLYERPKKAYRKQLYPSINVNQGGFVLNSLACAAAGIAAGEDRYLVFFVDDTNKSRFAFQSLKNPQPEIQNVFKARFREKNRSSKVTANSFIRKYDILNRAKKIERTTFPLVQEGDFFVFELK